MMNFFLKCYHDGRFIINFETGSIYSPKFKRELGCKHKLTGYICITITENKVRRQIGAHRLIWLCYHDYIDSNLVINHINGIKTDNRLVNLELVTSRENIIHAYRIGLVNGKDHSERLKRYYETHPNPNRKLTNDQVNEIRELFEHGEYSYRKLAKMFNVDKVTIKKVIEKIHYKF